jgi:predicted nucleic acid-binding protein
MGLTLSHGQTVFLDTAPLIYLFEAHETYGERMLRLLDDLTRFEAQVVTSMITYIEVLTAPERAGNSRLASKYRAFLTNSEQASIYPLNVSACEAAIRFRVKYGLRTPDAIQLGMAELCGADFVVTNDQAWRNVNELKIVLVSDLLNERGRCPCTEKRR